MTLPAKGTRRIVVDGVAYRWRVRPKPTYTEGLGASMRVSMQADLPGPVSVLTVTLGTSRPDSWVGADGEPVTPGRVRWFITRALDEGWDPSGRTPFEMRSSGTDDE